MFNVLNAQILHVYGLQFKDGVFTADAARECDQATLNKHLETFKPTRAYSASHDKNYLVATTRVKGETVYDILRIETTSTGVKTTGKIIKYSNRLPESEISDESQIRLGMLTDEKSGWMVVIVEEELLNKARNHHEA